MQHGAVAMRSRSLPLGSNHPATARSRQQLLVQEASLSPGDMQVFEYLTTDLKKYMDRNGKGPNFPLTKPTIKVHIMLLPM